MFVQWFCRIEEQKARLVLRDQSKARLERHFTGSSEDSILKLFCNSRVGQKASVLTRVETRLSTGKAQRGDEEGASRLGTGAPNDSGR
jgi:hypothetical protein